MAVAPADPGNGLSQTYWIGGLPAYGWTGTPGYSDLQVPSKSDTFGEVSLYERIDWDNSTAKNTISNQQLRNPPFLGIGSTLSPGGPALTQYIGATGNPHHRILRGYIRRYNINPASGDNAKDPNQSYNSRLYFMWNPDTIERMYMAYDDLLNLLNPANLASGPDQASTKPVSMTTVGFHLFFDRQEEVARIKDHPGVLIDLAVFDLVARGGSPDGQLTAEALKNYDASAPGLKAPIAGSVDSTAQLTFDPTMAIAVIFSPYIVYYGTLTGVKATFEKFSHRMTPTRMTLELSMRLTGFGSLDGLKSADAQSVDEAKAAEAARNSPVAAVDPANVVDLQKGQLNLQGRMMAMKWGENWMAGRATPGGVLYAKELACSVWSKDDYNDVTGEHIPLGFDCSGFVSRCFYVIGWSQWLGISGCTDTNGLEAGEKAKPDAWVVWNIDEHKATLQAGGQTSEQIYQQAAEFILPGDIILRHGSGDAGHVAFIHSVVDKGKTYELLHTNKTGTPVHTENISIQDICGRYTKIMRAQPIKIGPGTSIDAPVGTVSGGSW